MNEMTHVLSQQGFRARITTAEFLRMCDAGVFEDGKIELVEGELQRMPPPMNLHAMRQAQVMFLLAQLLGLERVRGESGVPIDDDTALSCDAAVLKAPITSDRRFSADDFALVIEVAETTLRRDLGLKSGKYAAAYVPLYWVIDGKRLVVHVHAEPIDGEYTSVRTVRFGEPLAVPGTDATITLS